MQVTSEEIEIIKRLSREKSKRFGETFLVREKKSHELLVMKTVEKSNELGLKQLQNEASFSFETYGLPKIISIKENETHLSIFKNYAEGVPLSDYWYRVKRRHRLLRLRDIILSLEPLFSELKNQGIIHSDVKPENILINEANGKISCSLIDFGLAFKQSNLPERKTLFQLAYSAPEIVLNRLNCADQSSDVFSFCLVIYKLLNGRLPFSEGNPALQTQLQITYPIEKPFRIKKMVWKILEKGLVKHSFKKSPNKYSNTEIESFLKANNQRRYADFSEFATEFNKLFPEV
jgi:serine/threonine protein kinase